MTHKRNNYQLVCFIACATVMTLATESFAGGPYEGDRYLPQRRFHGYYPTIWRPWASGWQAPIHKEHLPTMRQTPTVAKPRPSSAADDDAPPVPPSVEPLPLEPLPPTVPGSDDAPELPTPPGLEGALPEPSTPGQTPMPPGLEDTMPEPATPNQTLEEPMNDSVPDAPSLDTPEETPLDPPAEMEEPGLIPPDLESMPDPALPPGFEMPNLEDDAPLTTPPVETPTEADPPARSSRVPTSGWTGRGASASEPRRMPAYNRLREPAPAAPVDDAYSGGTAPRRLSAATPVARPLPQRLPVPNDQGVVEPAAVQVRFNTPANTRQIVKSAPPSPATDTAKWHNPLRSGQQPVRRVVQENNPLR